MSEDVAAVMSSVWALVRSGPNFDGRDAGVQQAVEAAIDNAVAAERERLCAELSLAMQHSAWDGLLQLDDAMRNIGDALVQGPNVRHKRETPDE